MLPSMTHPQTTLETAPVYMAGVSDARIKGANALCFFFLTWEDSGEGVTGVA